MIIKNFHHTCEYQVEKIALTFFPLEVLGEESGVVIETKIENAQACVYATDGQRSETRQQALAENAQDMAMVLSVLLYETLAALTGVRPPWGVLYGVRPARLMHAQTDLLGKEGAADFFRRSLVSEDRIQLTQAVMERENAIIALSQKNSCSLYISIPFCPSRCAYCSFVSHSIQQAAHLIEPYLQRLTEELQITAQIVKTLGLRVESIYIGGGTPTTLTAAQLALLLQTVENGFSLQTVREYTCEAGRADTISEEKLQVMKRHGVNRISINPQSFSDTVLHYIGRQHTAQQAEDAFQLARQCGFDNINMDFIAGLKGDTPEQFCRSIQKAIALGADAITVHNLALKSGAYLATTQEKYDLSRQFAVREMVDVSAAQLRQNGYVPYYMYRQSKSLGALENVGWSKPGKACLYNVFMMDETHTVLAVGAGAVTKLKHPQTQQLERICNLKYPYEYLERFEEMLNRKQRIYAFYNA